MKISRILHAGYIFESFGVQIIFDPIFENPFSRNCYAYPDVEFNYTEIKAIKPSAVFISHYHDDHCSLDSLKFFDRHTEIFLYCLHEELFAILKELGFINVKALQTDVSVRIEGFEIIPRLALDADVDSIFEIKAEGLKILNVVDAWIDPSAMYKWAETSWDMVLWPFQTMREVEVIAPQFAKPAELPIEWLEQLKFLNPRFIVPSSCQFIQENWSWYRQAYFPISYKEFQKQVEAFLPSVIVHRLNPGVSIELDKRQLKSAKPLSWVIPRGDQEVDYEFDLKIKPTDTALIAKKFRKLTDKETKRVYDFCKTDLIQKYNTHQTGLSGMWKLVLYDHLGDSIHFYYQLQDGHIELLKTDSSTLWLTEVPLTKLFAALEEAESLSSMYLRMEAMPFEDIMCDPLIVSLFSGGVFGEYQRYQLKNYLKL